ncbi:UPF0549 protein C20orf43-like [Tropilaelaps mercedesae]|uniref:Replication termination factor 2 n=1 Tax=Tropilaelaps mercedesae TaxID=418985 RepID=A0A1V9X3G5_9ACAR|nr:UPF0549 protein C20orf43-like [Tropilaelaps mercedesae]
MGCDGGTIPRRDELVRTKQKDEHKDTNAQNAFKWKHCAISQQALKQPIVACDLGRLYNKEAIIQYLLKRADSPLEAAAHIRQLRDVTELVLTDNPAFKDVQTKGDEYVDHAIAAYICPTTGLEMNGKHKFVFNRLCGCVFSERARKNVNTEKCLKCGGSMKVTELIILNPGEEERKRMADRMIERKAVIRAARKKVKKEVNKEIGIEQYIGTPAFKKIKQERNKLDKEEAASSGTSAGSAKLILPEKAKGSYSIAKDPNASEALKSLFTSHETAKNKPKAHWITHNPLFY